MKEYKITGGSTLPQLVIFAQHFGVATFNLQNGESEISIKVDNLKIEDDRAHNQLRFRGKMQPANLPQCFIATFEQHKCPVVIKFDKLHQRGILTIGE